MSILQKYLPFVKEQVEFQERMRQKYGGNSFRQQLHQNTKDKFAALLADMEAADIQLDTPQQPRRSAAKLVNLNLTPADIEGLPEELIGELSISEADKAEFAILSILEDAGGIASLDRIIIGLYRKTGEIHKRSSVTSKLYRMAQKDLVFSVPSKKGVYASTSFTEEEAAELVSGSNAPD